MVPEAGVPALQYQDNGPVVELRGVNMLYTGGKNQVDALADVDLTICRGEFVCALGPSGCGKSTLLNLIAGLLKPTGGTITMLGKPITGVDRSRAVLFQTPTLYPWLSTFDNVAFGPRMQGMPAPQVRAETEKYLKLVGLEDFAKSKPYELSGGMKQRAALARVLVNQPEVILMDEPFGALDALTRANMQDLIRRMWKETGSTVFFITHDVDEALRLATKVVVLSNRPGRIVLEREVDFTRSIRDGQNDDTLFTPPYIALRREILSQINQ